ncbi:hypothetical protein T3H00_28420 [Pseudomonas fluorescens]|uniref:hypothetical protein n=1 Tax=Pseudomonas fluorescens TaxID=294 RepID=UPI002ACA0F6F|nr:hypothetical protein [Pseudomonas fluorescens]MDZ5436572.1 hypothetical protein [Pseudomonas fluorescens]
MGRALAIIGIVLTIGYAIFSWWLVGDRIETLRVMPLNEVGDFLAGAFGPLAILWLVLGFFQQGIELRQGTKALLMQADELKHSVEQQSALVEVSKRQLETELASVSQHSRQLERSAEPDIRFYFKDTVYVGDQSNARFILSNQGPKCDFLKANIVNFDGSFSEVFRTDSFISLEDSLMIPYNRLSAKEAVEISFSYIKGTGTESKQSFEVLVVSGDGGRINIKVSKLTMSA